MDFTERFGQWPTSLTEPPGRACLKLSEADFRVVEEPGFDFDHSGDHLCLLIQKTGLNTLELVDRLVSLFSVKAVDIGYFGLKDKHAITQQWFSVHLPGKVPELLGSALAERVDEPSGKNLEVNGDRRIRLLETARHSRKFRRGTHRLNRFHIVLREFEGDKAQVESRLVSIGQNGFPNYFGSQRFGIAGRNLVEAQRLFEHQENRTKSRRITRTKRSFYLSAARSFLFNEVLASRIRDASWLSPLVDEPLMLNGSRSLFTADADAEDDGKGYGSTEDRIRAGDIHTTGPLWGKRRESVESRVLDAEELTLESFAQFKRGLEASGSSGDRRALRVLPVGLEHRWIESKQASVALELRFGLPPGSYATSLVPELVKLK